MAQKRRRQGRKGGRRQRRDFDAQHRDRDALLRGDWDEVAETPLRPLPDDTELLQLALADLGRGIGRHPVFVWGQYKDDRDNLLAFDCLKGTTHRQNLGPGDLYIPAELSHEMGGRNRAGQLKATDAYYLQNNWRSALEIQDAALGVEYIPDLILRRAYAILYDDREQDAGLMTKNRGLVRHGIVFRSLTTEKAAASRFVPEASDAPFEQVPISVPGYLSEDDIQDIFRLAKDYCAFCIEKGLPIMWPKPGQWGKWPPEFMVFAEARLHYDDVELPWLRGEVATREAGFTCEPSQ